MINYVVAFLSTVVAYFGFEVLTLQKAVASMSETLEKNQKAIIGMQFRIRQLLEYAELIQMLNKTDDQITRVVKNICGKENLVTIDGLENEIWAEFNRIKESYASIVDLY